MLVGLITSAIAFLSYGALLISVTQKGIKGNQANSLFSLYLLDMLLLQVAYLGVSIAQNEQQALFWYALNIPFSTAQIIIYFFFVKEFLELGRPKKFVPISILIWFLIVGISIFFRSGVITSIYQNPTTGLFLPEIGPLASILSIPTLVFLGATLVDLARSHQGKSRSQQARIQYLFLAIVIVWAGMSANVMPALRQYPVDVLANILSAFLIAYAILRHQLLEISTALRKVLDSFISLLVLGIGSALILYFSSKIIHIGTDTHTLLLSAIITVITLIVLIPLRDRIQKFIRRTLFKTSYDGYMMIQRFNHTATSILDLKKLSDTLLLDVISTLRVRWGILLLNKDDDFHPFAWEGITEDQLFSLDQNQPILAWLSRNQTIFTTNSPNEALAQNIISRTQLGDPNLAGSELLIPLITRDNLIGVLCLGGKLNHRPYSQEDEQILLTIANNIASTIDNARLYEEIQTELKERKRMEAALKENEIIFSSFLEHSQVYVFFKDKNIRSIRLSKNYEQMLGKPISELLGKTMDEIFPSELAKSMVADDLRILNEGKPVNIIEEFNGRTYETSKFPVFIDGKPDMLAGITVDITERKQADEKIKEANKLLEDQLGEIKILQGYLREQVIRDPLTGLYNRRYLLETMERELARANRENYLVSVMMIDIDHFKDLNDTYGHQAGDYVLKELGILLQNSVRQGDIASRYGGDEFIIIMPGMSETEARKRAEKIRHEFASLCTKYDANQMFSAISIGVSFYPQHGKDVIEIVKASDSALYEAKQAGRNRVQIWKG